MTRHDGWADDRAEDRAEDRADTEGFEPTEGFEAAPVTPPAGEPSRPGVVTAAMVVWIMLGAGMLVVALLLAVSLITSSSGAGPGPVPVILMMLAFAAAGIVVVLAARRAGAGSRVARRGLTITGVVLAIVGLVQLTFLGVAGSWFVGFVAGAALLHLPAARDWYAQDPA